MYAAAETVHKQTECIHLMRLEKREREEKASVAIEEKTGRGQGEVKTIITTQCKPNEMGKRENKGSDRRTLGISQASKQTTEALSN